MENKAIITVITLGVLMMSAFACVLFTEDSDASSEITITEIGAPNPIMVTFPGPVDHIVSFSKGYTKTAVKLGVFDKIVLMDSGSKYSECGIDETKGLPESMFINYTASNSANIVTKMAELESQKKFDKNKDVIVVNKFSASSKQIDDLISAGYKVIGYYPKNYDQNIQVTEDLGKLWGSKNYQKVVQSMKDAPVKIKEKLDEAGIAGEKKVKAVSVSTNKIQTKGSMGGTLIEMGGGINVAADKNPSSTATSMASDPTFFAKNKIDILFYSPHNGKSADVYMKEMGISSDVKVVEIGNLWVSYGSNVDDGLWGYAGSMYPDYFSTSGDVYEPNDGDDKTLIYVGIGVLVLVAAVGVIYFVYFRQ